MSTKPVINNIYNSFNLNEQNTTTKNILQYSSTRYYKCCTLIKLFERHVQENE